MKKFLTLFFIFTIIMCVFNGKSSAVNYDSRDWNAQGTPYWDQYTTPTPDTGGFRSADKCSSNAEYNRRIYTSWLLDIWGFVKDVWLLFRELNRTVPQDASEIKANFSAAIPTVGNTIKIEFRELKDSEKGSGSNDTDTR